MADAIRGAFNLRLIVELSYALSSLIVHIAARRVAAVPRLTRRDRPPLPRRAQARRDQLSAPYHLAGLSLSPPSSPKPRPIVPVSATLRALVR